MEGLLVLIGMAILGFVAVGPILALIALVRANRAARRLGELDQLRDQVAKLSRQVAQGAATPAPAAEPQPAPKPSPAPQTPDDSLPLAIPPEREPSSPPPPQAPPAPKWTPPIATPPTTAPPLMQPPAPPKPPAPPRPPQPPRPPRPKIEWERWIGIRGAALLGAVALALAGLLFFKYSIEHGLITPPMRVVLGTMVGIGCLVGSEVLRRRDQRHVADGIAGAGIVILYAAFWAAHILYGLIPMFAAFALMALVTAACVAIAWRRSAFLVALLGLVGGFATPLLLSTGSDRPIGLFGYVLLLDLALLVLGHKRRWPSLGMLALVATVLIQALWIGARMGPERLFLGLIILGVFAALFVFAARLRPDEEARRTWLWTQTAAIFFPFAFAMYFAARVDLGPHLYPIAGLMALLSGAACWLAREREEYGLSIGAAAATVGVAGVWVMQHRSDGALAWETTGVVVGLAVLFHLFVERDRERPGFGGPAPAALMMAGGGFALMLWSVAASGTGFTPWPWILGFAALTALLYRQAGFPGRAVLQGPAAAALGIGLSWIHWMQDGAEAFPPTWVYLGLLVVAAVGVAAVAMTRRGEDVRRFAEHAATVLPVVLLVGLAFGPMLSGLGAVPALGTALMLGVLAALAATRLGSGWWYVAAAAATWLVQAAWFARYDDDTAVAFGIAVLTVVVFTAWPFLTARQFGTERPAWYAAALAGPVWFPMLLGLFQDAFGDDFVGVLPVALAAMSLAAVMQARKLWQPGEPMHKSALAWFAAVALGFVSVAIPLQLDKEWITIGWALQGVAVLALWRKLDHAGLKYFGLALLGAASVRLVANPALLGYYPRSAMRIVNWLMYTYLVPAAALVGSAMILKPLEVARLGDRERAFYVKPWPLGAIATSVSSVVVVFVWINLAIADWFSTGDVLTLSFGATPAQRLTVSIAWALYGLILLGIGMARSIQGLRWLSLAFLLGTIAKVFLYDLGHLRDLYRVFSLVGLAMSLLLVSFLYQRFVFRKDAAEAS